ncbi:hypothetical protein FQN51_005027 [Onygenales sp. PD_10]|nr:hypothetical protein FQN51_005027 [Onygenales sp. PD_10]
MVEIHKYHLPPTPLIPNFPRPLLHYKNILPRNTTTSHCNPAEVWALFTKNGWNVQWIFRYGHTQLSHYHSQAHECMAVLSGTASIRFGVADTSPDLDENTHGSAWEDGGVVLQARAGDVFVIPAGVAHKTHNCKPEAEFKLLSPGSGRGIEAEDPERVLSEIELEGFTMLGAYSGGSWDFVESGGIYEKPWAVPKPRLDPVFGRGERGLCKEWRGGDVPPRVVKM